MSILKRLKKLAAEDTKKREAIVSDTQFDDDRMNTLRKHWSSSAVMTDDYTSDIKEQKVATENLLPGELSAVIFQIGCYTIRSAQRVYKSSKAGDNETPATEEELEPLRRLEQSQHETSTGVSSTNTTSSCDELRITHEISARRNEHPQDSFTYICRAAQASNYSWSESIEAICTVKEDLSIADEDASLLILNTYMGDSFSVDTWYKLDSSGEISKLKLHPLDSDMEKRSFERL